MSPCWSCRASMLPSGVRSPFAGFAALGTPASPPWVANRPPGAMTSDASTPLRLDEKVALGVAVVANLAWGGFGYYLTKHKWPVLGTFFMVGSGVGLVATATGSMLAFYNSPRSEMV